jgi:hypothetical protein
MRAVQNYQNLAPPIVADPNGRKFSNYLPPMKETVIDKKATPGLCFVPPVCILACTCLRRTRGLDGVSLTLSS